ncbi:MULTISPECIES: hypothetical protein [unclassified Streptomyces]|uniref:hypothetical protein n=1 Tax=unclassified Streptomyces TaxID=2593676 RepID=UPI00070B96DB|nr:hypothetical protein [Streptomyces sp. Root1310]KQX63420.1 hypothetical protein ASD48_26030 [Streptomyces sp. Root1310]
MATTERDETKHPGLTIGIYRVDPETRVRTLVRAKRTLAPVDEPVDSLTFPPCGCSRCAGRSNP